MRAAVPCRAVETRDDLFQRLDRDKNGAVEPGEINRPSQRLFERLVRLVDRNGDGQLSADEFRAGTEKLNPRPTNDSGRLASQSADATNEMEETSVSKDRSPMARRANLLFRRLDANRDGTVTASEVPVDRRGFFDRAVRQQGTNNGLNRTQFREAMIRQSSGAGRPIGSENPRRRMAEFDVNGDSRLSQTEAPPVVRRHFSELDGNSDGFLDSNELQQFARIVRGDEPNKAKTPGP